MTDIAALDRLIEAVDAGTLGWNGIANACEIAGIGLIEAQIAASAYNGSLDAAKALHEALLPGWFPGLSQNIHTGIWFAWVQDKAQWHFSATDANPARAWLLAILSSHRAQIGGQ